MATVSIVLGEVGGVAASGGTIPVMKSVPAGKDSITSSGANQVSTLAAAAALGPSAQIWSISVSGGDVWLKFGAAPVASAGNDWLVRDGEIVNFSATVAAEKVAVIDA